MSARSSASSSSCCSLRNLPRWVLACSSCRIQTKHRKIKLPKSGFRYCRYFFLVFHILGKFWTKTNTYGLLGSSLVGFDLQLQFVHQVLQAQGILSIFLRLKIQEMSCQSIKYNLKHTYTTMNAEGKNLTICMALKTNTFSYFYHMLELPGTWAPWCVSRICECPLLLHCPSFAPFPPHSPAPSPENRPQQEKHL